MNTKTYQPKEKDVKRGWHLIDAKDQVLGRLSTQIVKLLVGKHKASYSAHMDSGDYVVVVNARDVKVTGAKEDQKVYYGHSQYPGGFKAVAYSKLKAENPTKIIVHAVKGMLPKNKLQAKRLTRLKMFEGAEHTYADKFKSAK